MILREPVLISAVTANARPPHRWRSTQIGHNLPQPNPKGVGGSSMRVIGFA